MSTKSGALMCSTHYIGHIPVDIYSKAPLPDASDSNYDKNKLVIQT